MINVSVIFSNLLKKNIDYAEKIHNPMTLINLVKPKGPWDYKNRMGTIWGRANYTRNTEFSFMGTIMSPDNIGNFHFGAVSKATGMIPEELGLFGAGIVQVLSGTSRKEFILKSATKLFSVLLASKRPLITELADKLRLKYPLLPTISPCPTMRLEAIRSIIPISCRRYPKSV